MPRLAYLYIYLFNIEPLSEEPLVRCLFFNIFVILCHAWFIYSFICLFNIEPLVQNPLVHQYPLGLFISYYY